LPHIVVLIIDWRGVQLVIQLVQGSISDILINCFFFSFDFLFPILPLFT